MGERQRLYIHLTHMEEDTATPFGQAKRSRDLQRELLVGQLSGEQRADFNELWEAERVFRRMELKAAYRFGFREGVRRRYLLRRRNK